MGGKCSLVIELFFYDLLLLIIKELGVMEMNDDKLQFDEVKIEDINK